jgi:micrococcal nuclease
VAIKKLNKYFYIGLAFVFIFFGVLDLFGAGTTQTDTQTNISPTPLVTNTIPSTVTTTPITDPTPTPTPTPSDLVQVTRVIDGDTVELQTGETVRYIGIDTPETVHPDKPEMCFGRAASHKNNELVKDKWVRLEKDVSDTDRYGRLLRYVWVDGVLINELLVKEGFALSSTYPPDVKYQNLFVAAQKHARDNNLGLWSECQNATPVPTTPPQTGGCNIKGNISADGEKIYHLQGCGSYSKTVIDETQGEKYFCSEGDAQKAGWRKAKNC